MGYEYINSKNNVLYTYLRLRNIMQISICCFPVIGIIIFIISLQYLKITSNIFLEYFSQHYLNAENGTVLDWTFIEYRYIRKNILISIYVCKLFQSKPRLDPDECERTFIIPNMLKLFVLLFYTIIIIILCIIYIHIYYIRVLLFIILV